MAHQVGEGRGGDRRGQRPAHFLSPWLSVGDVSVVALDPRPTPPRPSAAGWPAAVWWPVVALTDASCIPITAEQRAEMSAGQLQSRLGQVRTFFFDEVPKI